MPCSMRGSLTTSSGMETAAERRTGARKGGCAGMVRSEAAARRGLRIGQHREIHHALKRGSLPDLAVIRTSWTAPGQSSPTAPSKAKALRGDT